MMIVVVVASYSSKIRGVDFSPPRVLYRSALVDDDEIFERSGMPPEEEEERRSRVVDRRRRHDRHDRV